MSSLNKAMIIGRLGDDPELRQTQSNTSVATISVATTERYKDRNGDQQEKTEWHRVVVWGKLADICDQYLNKGDLAYFEGPIETNKWTDKDGNDRYSTQVKALNMVMLGGNGSGGNSGGDGPQNSGSGTDLSDMDDMDDDLPFTWLIMLFGSGLISWFI